MNKIISDYWYKIRYTYVFMLFSIGVCAHGGFAYIYFFLFFFLPLHVKSGSRGIFFYFSVVSYGLALVMTLGAIEGIIVIGL